MAGRRWTLREEAMFFRAALATWRRGTWFRGRRISRLALVAQRIGRTPDACRRHAHRLGVASYLRDRRGDPPRGRMFDPNPSPATRSQRRSRAVKKMTDEQRVAAVALGVLQDVERTGMPGRPRFRSAGGAGQDAPVLSVGSLTNADLKALGLVRVGR